MGSNTPLIDQKRSLYPHPTLELDSFTRADEFIAAINTIDTALYLILYTEEKLSKKSSIDAVQLACVKELETLKNKILQHPNYSIFQEHKKQTTLQEEIKEQGGIIENDEQFMTWLGSIIPENNHKLSNAETFKKKFLERVLRSGSFEEEIMYGQYEKQIIDKTILGVLDMTKKRNALIIILNIPHGYNETKLYLYKLPIIYTKNKTQIKPSIILSESYFNTEHGTNTKI